MFRFSLCAKSYVFLLGTSIGVKFHIAVRDIRIDVDSCIDMERRLHGYTHFYVLLLPSGLLQTVVDT
jgi:hypothetical protein